MILIIAGGRNYEFTEDDIDFLNNIKDVTEVVSGGATGADTCGEIWAMQNRIPVTKFPALWEKYGRAAGPRRNKEMADYANAVVLFKGGSGTANMYRHAKNSDLIIFDRR